MNRYELLTIFANNITEEQKENAVNKYVQLIEKNNGKVQVVNKWGTKKLAYPINYKREGYYVLIEFDSTPELPKKVSELMRIDEVVLRSLCIKKN